MGDTTTVKLLITSLDETGVHVFLNVLVNDIKCRFLLDTGASKTVLDKAWFEKHVGNKKLKTMKQETTGLHSSVSESHSGKVEKLKIGAIEVKKYQFAAIDLSHVNSTYAKIGVKKIQGILGSDLLVEFGALIDYKKKKITLEKA